TNPSHLRAFALMICLVLSTSTLFPHFPNYLVFNLGLDPETDMSWVYIVGGLATLITMPLIGPLADLLGKRPRYRGMARGPVLSCVMTLVSVVLVSYVRPVDAAPAAPTEEEAAEAGVVLVENLP